MKVEIGAMVNGVFIKKGNVVKMRSKKAENRNGFYSTVINVDEEKIVFIPRDDEEDDGNECCFYWNDIDFIELTQ